MKTIFSAMALLAAVMITSLCFAFPELITPSFKNVGANMATLILRSSENGSGAFTLRPGADADCGDETKVAFGPYSSGSYHGSLPIFANATGNYTVRNLQHNSSYTACFTAYSASAANINPTPVFANLSTNSAKAFTTPGWGLSGSAGFSAGTINSPSLAFAPDGTPYVAYGDQSNSYKATVKKFSAGSWSSVGSTSGFSDGPAISVSLAFAPDGTPYITYGGNDYNSTKATVMSYSASTDSWSEVGAVGGFSADTAVYTSLAFAPDGSPYVAFLDYGNFGVTVMKYDGNSWSQVGSLGFSGSDAAFVSLAFAPDGTPYVAYQDSGSATKATVMRFNGTSWIPVGNAGFSANAAYSVSLAIAPDGTPHVAYRDGGNTNKSTVMKYNGTAWVNVGTAGFSAGGADFTSLAIAPDGTPYVAYQDWSSSNKATVMKFTGTWSNVVSAGFSSGAAGFTSLSFAPDGTPYVAFVDSSSGSKATVMKLGNKPTISGTPATSIVVGNEYIFNPSYTDAVSFSISNKPSWATFYPVTGNLIGTPTTAGPNPNIVITANNIYGSTSLAAFSIVVTDATVTGSVRTFPALTTYSTISAALEAITGSDTLHILDSIPPEGVNYSESGVITLEGGYATGWNTRSGFSPVSSLTIISGTLIVDQIVVQ